MPSTAFAKVLAALQGIVYVLWPTTALAATITLDSSLGKVPLLAWLMVFILSTVSAMAALLNRMKVDVPPRLGFFIASHMLGSWMSGALMFFLGEAMNWHDFIEVILIAVGAYGGAQLIDRWAGALTNRIAAETEGAANGTKTGSTPK